MKKSAIVLIIILSIFAFTAMFIIDHISIVIPFYFLLTQSILGIILINTYNRAIYFQDIRILFIITFSLYAIFCPFVQIIQLDSFSETMPLTTFCFGLGLAGYNIGNIVYPKNWENIIIEKRNVNYTSIICILGIEIILAILYLMKIGIPIFGQLGSLDRSMFFDSIDQIWILLTSSISITSCLLIYYSSKAKTIEALVGSGLVIFYILLQLSMGNRRDFLPIILFFTANILTQRKLKLNIITIIFGTFIFLSSFWVSQQRAMTNLEGKDAVNAAIVANEFIYPMQTLSYVIQDHWDFRYGSTYFFLPFQIMTPRFLYPSKPNDLGTEFVNKTFGEGWQGYAYTPITEAYLNFGVIGPPLIFFIFSILINNLIAAFKSGRIGFFYFWGYALIFDFCRGSFSTILYQLVLSMIVYIITLKIISVKLKIKL